MPAWTNPFTRGYYWTQPVLTSQLWLIIVWSDSDFLDCRISTILPWRWHPNSEWRNPKSGRTTLLTAEASSSSWILEVGNSAIQITKRLASARTTCHYSTLITKHHEILTQNNNSSYASFLENKLHTHSRSHSCWNNPNLTQSRTQISRPKHHKSHTKLLHANSIGNDPTDADTIGSTTTNYRHQITTTSYTLPHTHTKILHTPYTRNTHHSN